MRKAIIFDPAKQLNKNVNLLTLNFNTTVFIVVDDLMVQNPPSSLISIVGVEAHAAFLRK